MSSGFSGFPLRGAVANPDIEPREIRVATFINVHEWTFRQVVFVFYVSIGNHILVNYMQRYKEYFYPPNLFVEKCIKYKSALYLLFAQLANFLLCFLTVLSNHQRLR